MLAAATQGLSVSLVVLFLAIFGRVVFRWRDEEELRPVDPERSGKWWRATWAVLALGIMPPVLAHMSYVATPQFFDFSTRVSLTLVGLVLLNAAGCMAEMGFNLNRGERPAAAAPFWALPLAFLLFAMVTA